jgi:predicted phosphodiesterase
MDDTVPSLTATSDPIRFGVIGDYGDGSQAEQDVANLVKSWNPDFIITTGDNNYPDGAASTIDAHIGQFYHEFIYPYKGTYGSGATTNRFFPTLGNNDWDTLSAKPYFDYFTLPGNERYYDYVWGPVHFFVIDSAAREPDGNSSSSIQATWLHNQLSASTSVWNLVYLHHPPYTSGSVTSNTTLQWPYATWGADVVMSGHSHTYERIFRDGIVYFVNGLGGDSIQSFSSTISGSQFRYNGDFGAMLVDADNTQITFQFFKRGGTLIDSYSLHKPSAFSKTNPSNGALDQARDVILSWSTSDNASSYQYCIDTVNDGACNSSWINNGTATSKALSNLSPSVTYYWQVRAVNDTGTTMANDRAWWSFTIATACYTLTKSVNPPGSGVINVSPPPNCNGGTQYTAGTNVQLTASANPGTSYIFNYWSGNMASTSTNPLSVMITGDTNVTANFKEINPTFADVPTSYWAWDYIERLYAAGLTSGCSTSPLLYCPTSSVTRDQMAVFLLRAKHGANYVPPRATGIFQDVPTGYWAADWIEQLVTEGITSGCSVNPKQYCPTAPVTRDQMAVFLLKAKHGSSYVPPKAIGMFADVPTTYWAADWIEALANEGITGGCSTNPLKYCPGTPVTRDQMAVFLVKNFNLP